MGEGSGRSLRIEHVLYGLAALGVLAALLVLAPFGLFVVLPQVSDEIDLVRLSRQMDGMAPEVELAWSERYTPGSCCSYLVGMALVPRGTPLPEGTGEIQVVERVEDEILIDGGTSDFTRFEHDCASCAPSTLGPALAHHPGHVVWMVSRAAAYRD